MEIELNENDMQQALDDADLIMNFISKCLELLPNDIENDT
jgi:hypothetical protein